MTSGNVSILRETTCARSSRRWKRGRTGVCIRERERATRGRTEEEREKDRARGKRRYVTLTLSGLT